MHAVRIFLIGLCHVSLNMHLSHVTFIPGTMAVVNGTQAAQCTGKYINYGAMERGGCIKSEMATTTCVVNDSATTVSL